MRVLSSGKRSYIHYIMLRALVFFLLLFLLYVSNENWCTAKAKNIRLYGLLFFSFFFLSTFARKEEKKTFFIIIISRPRSYVRINRELKTCEEWTKEWKIKNTSILHLFRDFACSTMLRFFFGAIVFGHSEGTRKK